MCTNVILLFVCVVAVICVVTTFGLPGKLVSRKLTYNLTKAAINCVNDCVNINTWSILQFKSGHVWRHYSDSDKANNIYLFIFFWERRSFFYFYGRLSEVFNPSHAEMSCEKKALFFCRAQLFLKAWRSLCSVSKSMLCSCAYCFLIIHKRMLCFFRLNNKKIFDNLVKYMKRRFTCPSNHLHQMPTN